MLYTLKKYFWYSKIFKNKNNFNPIRYLFFINNLANINLNIFNNILIKKKKKIKTRNFLIRNIKNRLKKKSSRVLYFLKFNFIILNNLLNLPPLSTFLSLYGINSLKFCEEYNKLNLNFFFDNVVINFFIIIYKDLTYQFFFSFPKFNILFQSLDYNLNFLVNYKDNKNNNLNYIKYLHKYFITLSNYDLDLNIFFKNYSFYDLWLFYFIYNLYKNIINIDVNFDNLNYNELKFNDNKNKENYLKKNIISQNIIYNYLYKYDSFSQILFSNLNTYNLKFKLINFKLIK